MIACWLLVRQQEHVFKAVIYLISHVDYVHIRYTVAAFLFLFVLPKYRLTCELFSFPPFKRFTCKLKIHYINYCSVQVSSPCVSWLNVDKGFFPSTLRCGLKTLSFPPGIYTKLSNRCFFILQIFNFAQLLLSVYAINSQIGRMFAIVSTLSDPV